jgi:hypothetical protein
LKYGFSPWDHFRFSPECDLDNLTVIVKYTINSESQRIFLQWDLREISEVDSIAIEEDFLNKPSDNTRIKGAKQIKLGWRSFSIDKESGGVDLGRELALSCISDELKDMLSGNDFIALEHPIMKAELLESCLDIIPHPEGSSPVSLRTHSLSEIKTLLQAMQDDVHYYSYCRHESLTPRDVRRILNHIDEEELSQYSVLPPCNDRASIRDKDCWDDFYSKCIAWHYDNLQICYRHFVDHAFTTLKDTLSLYSGGPVKYIVTLKEADKTPFICSYPQFHTHVTWVPVRNMTEASTTVSLCTSEENIESWDYSEASIEKAIAEYDRLGRKSQHIGWKSCWASRFVDKPNGKDALRKSVYEKLRDEIKKIFE